MLKRIDPADVALGMFIHKMEGNWFLHPFWRGRFLLTDPRQLDRLQSSRVPAVVIDTERGLSPVEPASAPQAARPAVAAPARKRLPEPAAHATPAVPTHASPRVLSAPPAATSRGFGKANAIADRGLKVVAHVFLEMRLGKTITSSSVSPIIDSIMTSMQSNPFAFNGLMRFRRDSEAVYRHALATSALMIALGRNLHLSPMDLHAAGLAGLLLDSGISLLPIEDAERNGDPRTLPPEVWQSHVQLGHDFILRSRLSETIARACLEHHERFDGAGWPHGASGSNVSKLGRMAAICDAYDLLASPSDGRPGLDPADALQRMKDDTGAYDPDLLAAFETVVGAWPTGAVVALRSGRLAVVIEQNRDALDRPLIAVFFVPGTGQPVDDVWIDLNTCYGADAIVGPAAIADLPGMAQPDATAALIRAIERVTEGSKQPRRVARAA